MRYTPVELRHIRVGRSLFGYKRHDIDKLLEDVADSFEEVWSERGELADKVEDLGKILADVKERESLLAATLVSAERAAADARDQAKQEAELIIAEAHIEARSVTRGAQGERDRLFGEVRRVETLLRAALGHRRGDEAGAAGLGGSRRGRGGVAEARGHAGVPGGDSPGRRSAAGRRPTSRRRTTCRSCRPFSPSREDRRTTTAPAPGRNFSWG